MKILFCHDHMFHLYNNDYYSPGKLSTQQMGTYQNLGEHITIVSRAKVVNSIDSTKYKKVTSENISFCQFPDASNIRSLISNARLVNVAKEIIKNYDLVIVRLPSEIGNIFANAAKILNKPLLVEVVACVWDNLYYFGSLKAKLYAPLAYFRMRSYVKKGDFVHYVTSGFLQNRYPASDNAITLAASDVILSASHQMALNKPNKDKYRVNLGVIGSMDNKIKGLPLALKALYLLNEKQKNRFHLHVIGPGKDERLKKIALKLGVLNNITFVGSLSDAEAVQQYLHKNIDIYIQPSYQEGMPRAVLEAMGRGIPCIVSSAGGMPEIVSQQFVHPKGDYKKLASLIINLTSSNELYHIQSNNSLRVAGLFSFDSLMARRIKFYNNIKENISENLICNNQS